MGKPRVLFIGNIANLSYNCVKLLREKGFDARLLIPEEPDYKNPEWKEVERTPWVATIGKGIAGWLDRISAVRKTDVVVATGIGITYAWLFRLFGKRVVAYSMGSDFREVYFQKDLTGFAMRFGFKHSNAVAYCNPDVTEKMKGEGLKPVFIPFTFPLKKFVKPEGRKVIFFCPSRIDWSGPGAKDTHVFIRGFAEFLNARGGRKDRGLFEFRLAEWGRDVNKAKRLVKELKIGGNVRFLKFMEKQKLFGEYSSCDAVVDQFNVGSMGMAATEAMSFGRVVFARIDAGGYAGSYGVMPPVFNCRTPEEVAAKLTEFGASKKAYAEAGRKIHEWIRKEHSPELITSRFEKTFNT